MTELEKQLLSALGNYSRTTQAGRVGGAFGEWRENVGALCNGERGAERRRVTLESTGGTLERATAALSR